MRSTLTATAVTLCLGASIAAAQVAPGPTDPGTVTQPTPAPPPPPPPPPVPVPAPPLITQDGPRLVVVVRAERPRPLRVGDTACVEFARDGAAARAVCLNGGSVLGVESRLGGAPTEQPAATTERLGPQAVRVTLDAGALVLRDGARYRVRTLVTRSGQTQPAASKDGEFRWRAWRIVGCTAKGPTRIFRNTAGADRRVGLSFDDGPSGYTPAMLRLLAEFKVHATFFVIGDLVRWRSDLLRRALREGHMIGNHSLHHEMPANPAGIAATQQIIHDATGFTPCSFRPPGGSYNSGMGAAVQGMGMRTIIWSVDTRDWTRPGAWRIAHTALSARAGDIILMHDGGGPRGETLAATREVLTGLAAEGLKPVPIEELLGETPVYAYGG